MTRLETERLILRGPLAADLPAWLAFFLSARAIYVGGGPRIDEGRAWRAFATIIGHWTINGCGPFVLEDRASGRALGSAGPWYPALWPEKELGWTIWRPEAEGQGLAHEAVVALRARTYRDLGWPTAVSYIDARNTRSIALAERLGAVRDTTAEAPPDDDPTLVYRHPAPEVLQ
ncbi:MAG: GNAT family N-acetyltransferase [Pseudomonadota bacterium]